MAKEHGGEARSQAERELEEMGTLLAPLKGYGSLRGLDALHRHLVEKHHWRLAEVRALSPEDIRVLVTTSELDNLMLQKSKRST